MSYRIVACRNRTFTVVDLVERREFPGFWHVSAAIAFIRLLRGSIFPS